MSITKKKQQNKTKENDTYFYQKKLDWKSFWYTFRSLSNL